MNNIILVRDGFVAHVKGFGSNGRGSRTHISELDLITPFGIFIPSHSGGMRACDVLNKRADRVLMYGNPMISDDPSSSAGILIDDSGSVARVEMGHNSRIDIYPQGKRGVIIMEGTPGYDEVMAACVDLTTTIEEACEMYRKYINYSPENLIIRPLQYYVDLWERHKDERKLVEQMVGDHKGKPII